jgi:hypothetical protein
MEKAYDLKDLAKKLQSKGLDVAEEAAGEAYEAIKEWFTESAALSVNPFDNMVVPFLAQIDSVVLPAIDKIDGEKN